MGDAELAKWLGFTDAEMEAHPDLIAKLDPKKRALFERMAEVEGELILWQAGVGKKPEGVIVCGRREIRGAGRD